MLPRPATVTEKYLQAIYEELKKMNETEEKSKDTAQSYEPVEMDGRPRCDVCGKTFKTESSLKAHKTRVHK